FEPPPAFGERMRITRPQVLRALPAIAINIVPLVGVVEFGWPVISLFLLFILETWMLIALDVLRIAMAPAKGLLERIDVLGTAFISFVIGSIFVLIQLVAAILILDKEQFDRMADHNPATDFLRYVHSLDLAWPLAILALIHVGFFVRAIATKKDAVGDG